MHGVTMSAISSSCASQSTVVSFRTSMPPKKVTSQDMPTIALLRKDSGSRQNMLIATAKLLDAAVVFDGTTTVAKSTDRFQTTLPLQKIRRDLGINATDVIVALRFVNVTTLNATSCSSKLIRGWGSGRVPVLKYRDMTDFVKKRPLADRGSSPSQPVSKRHKSKSATVSSPPCSTAPTNADVQLSGVSF